MEAMKINPQLRKPVGVLLKMSEDQRLREIEEKQEIYRMDQESRMDGAYNDGRNEGIKEGRQEEKREAARKMKTWGDPIKKITDITGLSPEEIAKL